MCCCCVCVCVIRAGQSATVAKFCVGHTVVTSGLRVGHFHDSPLTISRHQTNCSTNRYFCCSEAILCWLCVVASGTTISDSQHTSQPLRITLIATQNAGVHPYLRHIANPLSVASYHACTKFIQPSSSIAPLALYSDATTIFQLSPSVATASQPCDRHAVV